MKASSSGWDPEFAKGEFELGYHDRAVNRVIVVPLTEVTFPTESPSAFQLVDLEGQVRRKKMNFRVLLTGVQQHLPR